MNDAELKTKNLLLEVAKIAALETLKGAGLYNDEMSQREAFREFGEANVRTWETLGECKSIKVGSRNSRIVYSRIELLTIKKTKELSLRGISL